MSAGPAAILRPAATPTDSPESCHLLGPFALLVQLALFLLAFSSLLVKRHRERPQRPTLIFALDVSKQAIGGAVLHTGNIVGAWFGGEKHRAGGGAAANACVWYFLNIAIDTTFGVLLVYLYLRMLNHILHGAQGSVVRTGYYGEPPRMRVYLAQLGTFLLTLLMMKLTVIFLLAQYPAPFLAAAEWLLHPVLVWQSERLELVVVMLIVPLVMNAMQFWVVDTVIKARIGEAHRAGEAVRRRSSTATVVARGGTLGSRLRSKRKTSAELERALDSGAASMTDSDSDANAADMIGSHNPALVFIEDGSLPPQHHRRSAANSSSHRRPSSKADHSGADHILVSVDASASSSDGTGSIATFSNESSTSDRALLMGARKAKSGSLAD